MYSLQIIEYQILIEIVFFIRLNILLRNQFNQINNELFSISYFNDLTLNKDWLYCNTPISLPISEKKCFTFLVVASSPVALK